MLANLRILVPDATTNYILNPALRYDTTGWTAAGSTISRILDQARFNYASLQVITSGVALREGAYYRVSSLSGISEPITVSAYVRGNVGNELVHIRLINSGGKEWVSKVCSLRTDQWQRISVSGFSTGTNDLRLYVETDGTARAVTFYVDGAQMERKAYSTTYCDGNQPGCRWNIIDHNSISTRDAYTRAGGRWVNLAGPARGNDDIYVTVLSGLGMPKLQMNTQSWALAAGSYFQSTKVLDRVLTLNFFTKKKDLLSRCNPDLSKLFQLRQELIDLFKPDRTGGEEPFQFEYDDGDRALRIWARYEAGLEGNWDVRNQWVNSFPVRLLAVDPYWTEDGQNATALNFINTSSSRPINGIIMRENGEWHNMNYGFNVSPSGWPGSMVYGKKGELYVSGTFTVSNNNVLAIDPLKTTQRIAMWNGTSWSDLGTAVFAPAGVVGGIYSMYVAPNGDLYVTGNFTQIGGVAANYIAKWNGSVWSALGTGLDALCYVITGDINGNIYVGGSFTTAGGIVAQRVARWDGAWHQMGARRGMNNGVITIAINSDGTKVYIGGFFTDEYGLVTTTLNYVALYTPSTNLFSAVGSGFNDVVRSLSFSPYSGVLYATGNFTISGTTTLNHVSSWNGSTWIPYGTGLPVVVYTIAILQGEKLVVNIGSGGGFYYWNGTSWVRQDIEIETGLKVISNSKGDLILGSSAINQTNIKYSAITYVTNNGTAEIKPVIYIYGPGKLYWIENQTNKKRIYLNMTIASSEEVIIDFSSGTVTSNTRGNIINEIISGSDFGNFTLVPGQNKLCCFMTNDVNSNMVIYYTPRHWSADAVVRQDAWVS